MVIADKSGLWEMMYVESLFVLMFSFAIVLLFAWVLFDDAEIVRLVIWFKKKRQRFCRGGSDDNI